MPTSVPGEAPPPGGRFSVYDFFFDAAKDSWRLWSELIDTTPIPADAKFRWEQGRHTLTMLSMVALTGDGERLRQSPWSARLWANPYGNVLAGASSSPRLTRCATRTCWTVQ